VPKAVENFSKKGGLRRELKRGNSPILINCVPFFDSFMLITMTYTA